VSQWRHTSVTGFLQGHHGLSQGCEIGVKEGFYEGMQEGRQSLRGGLVISEVPRKGQGTNAHTNTQTHTHTHTSHLVGLLWGLGVVDEEMADL
jgi:hypothetical protein